MSKKSGNDQFAAWVIGMIALIAMNQAPRAFGWGSYGHQQVNYAAVELLSDERHDHPMAKCLNDNKGMIQRLALTPDYDWKKLGTEIDKDYKNVPHDVRKTTLKDKATGKEIPNPNYIQNFKSTDPRFKSDGFEHPLHYFEADAFVDIKDIQTLSSKYSRNFTDVMQDLITGRKQHKQWIQTVDPGKADATPATEVGQDHKEKPAENIDFVRAHGTAPWRIKQLYDLGVEHLKSGAIEEALIYLGAMGHYVGDMSQPFHTSLNFDGEYDPKAAIRPAKQKGQQPLSTGIHAAFEAEMFKYDADDPDKNTFMYENFDPTHKNVMNFAKTDLNLKPISGDKVVSEVMEVIASSPPYVQPLLDALWEAVEKHPVSHQDNSDQDQGGDQSGNPGKGKPPGRHPSSTKAYPQTKKVNAKSVRKPASLPTAMEVAEIRIAESSKLLARLWLGAYESAFPKAKAGTKTSTTPFKCGPIAFEGGVGSPKFREAVVELYPIPDYLPAGHRGAPHHPSPHTDTPPHPEDPGSSGSNSDTDIPRNRSEKPSKPSSGAVKAFRDSTLNFEPSK